MNFRQVSRLLGIVLMVLAGAMATAIPWAFIEDTTQTALAFGAAVLTTLACGGGLWFAGRGARGSLYRREALLTVALTWIMLGVFGGLPYLFDGAFSNPADAYFEAISGFTTTGSTVLTNIEGISGALHWWRGMTHWLGGMGVIVLFVAVLPKLGVGGKLLFKTEVPGPITEGLRPKIRETSSALWWIYVSMTAALALLLYLLGPGPQEVEAQGLSPNAVMDLHNALIHAFATMATGGFSTLGDSVAGFNSPVVEWLITGFMFLAGVNFSLYYLVVQRQGAKALEDTELRVYTALVVLAGLIVSLTIWGSAASAEGWGARHASVLDALRLGFFQVIGVITTTGFATDDFNLYPPLPRLLLVTLMFVGGMAGSTAGGMKVFRYVVAAKAIYRQVYVTFRPNAVRKIRVNKRSVNDDIVHSIIAFLTLGVGVFLLASLYIAALGLDIVTATTSVAATLFNIGPGLERVGAVENFAFMPTSGKLLLSFCMILGRLEFYALLVLFVPDFWRR